jgi:hypothetical protein
MEKFPGNHVEEVPKPTPQEQEVAVIEEEDRNIALYADTILNAAKKNGYDFLRATQAQIERYSNGEHDEQRTELFPYWSNEELKELHDTLWKKIKEDFD